MVKKQFRDVKLSRGSAKEFNQKNKHNSCILYFLYVPIRIKIFQVVHFIIELKALEDNEDGCFAFIFL